MNLQRRVYRAVFMIATHVPTVLFNYQVRVEESDSVLGPLQIKTAVES